jgi:hypothetical protein
VPCSSEPSPAVACCFTTWQHVLVVPWYTPVDHRSSPIARHRLPFYNLAKAGQEFQKRQVIEINICATSTAPELDAALQLDLVAPRIESNQVEKVIRNIVPNV